jgi:hypothetical protein
MGRRTIATKHGDEALASAVMRAALGVTVATHDDQSRPGMFDLILTYPDGRRAAAEVVSTRDQALMELEAAIAKRGYVPTPELTRMWYILVDPGARLRSVARALPRHLADLERAGIHRLRGPHHLRDPWPPELRSLGVVSCWSRLPTERHPPGFYVMPFPRGAWQSSGDDLVQACVGFLDTLRDVPAKLLASGLSERHAVVVVTIDWLGFWASIADGVWPTTAPALPDGVDCLWMIVLRSAPVRAIYWPGDGLWHDIVLTEDQLDATLSG